MQVSTKDLNDSPVSSISKQSSVKGFSKTVKIQMKKSAAELELSNKNLRTEFENMKLRGKVAELEEKIHKTKGKIKAGKKENQVKDEMIKKMSSFILKREKQFQEVIKEETERSGEIIKEKQGKIDLFNREYCAKFSSKSTQAMIDTTFEEILAGKNEEISRLQELVEKNESNHVEEISILQEQVLLFEQELAKAHELIAKMKS